MGWMVYIEGTSRKVLNLCFGHLDRGDGDGYGSGYGWSRGEGFGGGKGYGGDYDKDFISSNGTGNGFGTLGGREGDGHSSYFWIG